MLNISDNKISDHIKLEDFKSYKLLKKSRITNFHLLIAGIFLLVNLIFLFLPWTQNISAKGYVTTRSPEQRPQAIQSVISGRIDRWYVKEGDYVELGDTIVFITEIKSEYFDPNLIERINEQMNAKMQSVASYEQKITALEAQYDALRNSLKLKRSQTLNKIEQAKNKVQMDSMNLLAVETNFKIAENQLERTKKLHEKGLKSLTQLQEKEYKAQSANAKLVVQKNKLLNQRNALSNLQIELSAVERDYANKLAKSMSDRQSAISAKLESVVSASKLRNKLSNYNQRRKYYYITASQSGYITKTIKKGIGQTVKQGTDIATIMPSKYDLAVEIYLKPQDISLINYGDHVQFRFDGWPAIIISGWPESSTGVFSGNIVAIDQFINDNGQYRVIVSPDASRKKWPENLKVGTGAKSFIMLNEVPIWYEIWRQLNGFPADFYAKEKRGKNSIKRKAPIKSVK